MPHFSRHWKPSLLQAHWGRWLHTLLLWLDCLFTVQVRECSSPPSPVELSTWQPLLQGCWEGASTPAFSSRLVYLQFKWAMPLPHSPELRVPRSLWYVSFLLLLLVYYSGFFFILPQVGASLSRGLCWFVPGSTDLPLICSPGDLPSKIGAGIWRHGSPPGFSI
jgi:hypothetical protein